MNFDNVQVKIAQQRVSELVRQIERQSIDVPWFDLPPRRLERVWRSDEEE